MPPVRPIAMNDKSMRRGKPAPRIIPAKAMPRPLSFLGSALILLSDKIPNTKAIGAAIMERISVKLTIPQTREAIARGSLCSGPVKFDWSFDGDTGGGGIGGGNEFTVEP